MIVVDVERLNSPSTAFCAVKTTGRGCFVQRMRTINKTYTTAQHVLHGPPRYTTGPPAAVTGGSA